MSWNYRVLVKDNLHYPEGFNPEMLFGECYYDNPEDTIPHSYGTPQHVQETAQELEWMLDKMKEALSKPFISIKDFPQEYKY